MDTLLEKCYTIHKRGIYSMVEKDDIGAYYVYDFYQARYESHPAGSIRGIEREASYLV